MARRKSFLILLLSLLGLMWTVPASAHDALSDSDPADGAVLEEAPQSVTLTFTGEPIDVAPQMILRQGDETIAELEPHLSGFNVTADLPDMGPGDYKIAYSIVSSDGHRIEGALSMTIGGGNPGAAEDASKAPLSEEPATEVPENGENTGDNGAVTWIRIGGFIVVGLGLFVIISRKLRQR